MVHPNVQSNLKAAVNGAVAVVPFIFKKDLKVHSRELRWQVPRLLYIFSRFHGHLISCHIQPHVPRLFS